MRVSDINPGEVKWVRTRIDGHRALVARFEVRGGADRG